MVLPKQERILYTTIVFSENTLYEYKKIRFNTHIFIIEIDKIIFDQTLK